METRRIKHVPLVDFLVLFLVLFCFSGTESYGDEHKIILKNHEKEQNTEFKSHKPCEVMRFLFVLLNLEIHVVSGLGHVTCMREKQHCHLSYEMFQINPSFFPSLEVWIHRSENTNTLKIQSSPSPLFFF